VEILLELHGDRGFKDDKAMIGGLGKLVVVFMIVGQQKDITRRPVNTETSGWQTRRISKALRLMKMAEKFGIPVLTLIDTRCLSRAGSGRTDKVRLYLKWFVCRLLPL
jgi:acetyl-CoA carboxylase carboxyl transferase subunit alpha